MSVEITGSSRALGRESVAIALLVGFISLPFVGKPYHIDDAFFLQVTEAIVAAPLDPYSGQIDWWDRPLPLFLIDSNPPLLNYYLAPFAAISESSDLVLHLAMIPFTLLFAAGTLALGRRFTAHRWWVLLFTVTSVAVVVSGNVMRDVPAAALGIAAIASVVHGTDRDKHRWVFAGAFLAGLAMLTKYSAAVLFPVMLLYPVLRGRPRLCGWAAVTVAIFALWCLHNHWVYGELHILKQLGRGYSRPGHAWLDNLYGLPVVAGSVIYLLPAILFKSWASRDFAVMAAGALAMLAVLGSVPGYTGGGADWQYLLWSASGSALLLICLWAGLRDALPLARDRVDDEARDSVFLFVWLSGPLLFSVVFVPFQAVRHLLPALLPLVLIGFRYLGSRGGGLRASDRILLSALLVAQVGVALLVARADEEYAETYRDFATRARAVVAKWDARLGAPADGTIWFLGHWGWIRYAEQAGLRKLHTIGPRPQPGDFLIVPRFVDKGQVLQRLPQVEARLEQIDEIAYAGKTPIRTMHPIGAGFYAVISKPRRGRMPGVPYRFANTPPLEVFDLYRIRPDADRPQRPADDRPG